MEAADEGWSPMAMPMRPSPFYRLKSIAFAKPTSDVLLPRRPGGAGAAFLPRLAGGVVPLERADDIETEAILKLKRRREAAVADCAKVEEQLRKAREHLAKEAKARIAAEAQTQELRDRSRGLGQSLQVELTRLRSQQRLLRDLRAQLKGRGPRHIARRPSGEEGYGLDAMPVALEVVFTGNDCITNTVVLDGKTLQWSAPGFGSCRCDSLRIDPLGEGHVVAGPNGRTEVAVPPPGPEQREVLRHLATMAQACGIRLGGGAVEGLLAEAPPPTLLQTTAAAAIAADIAPQQQLSTGDGPGACRDQEATQQIEAGPELTPSEQQAAAPLEPELPPEDDGDAYEEDAEIELLRPGGLNLARLRHPAGSEALLDLRGGLVSLWRLADGRAAPPGGVPWLWSQELGGIDDRPWHLALMDDSNNEPSVTLSCGGGDMWWLARRTLTLGSASVREDVSVENVSGEEATFTVAEEAYDAVVDDAPEQGAASFRPVRLKPPGPGPWPTPVVLPPGGCWTASQTWVPAKVRT